MKKSRKGGERSKTKRDKKRATKEQAGIHRNNYHNLTTSEEGDCYGFFWERFCKQR